MAVGTLKTVGPRSDRGKSPDVVTQLFEYTFSSAYVSGGDTFTPSMLGLTEILFVMAEPTGDGGVAVYDHTNAKLKLLVSSGSGSKLAEAANGNQSASVSRLYVLGR
jgi:hypothetical protein